MGLRIFQVGKKQRSFQRVVAMLLLTLSFVDIAVIDFFVPELCEREGAIISMAKAAEVASHVGTDEGSRLADATDNKNQDSSLPSAFDEDCFCCCSHILPTAHFDFPILQTQLQKIASAQASLPNSPPLGLFRPPRIA